MATPKRHRKLITALIAVLASTASVSGCGETETDRSATGDATSTTGDEASSIAAGVFTGVTDTGEPIRVEVDGVGRVLFGWSSLPCAGDEPVRSTVAPFDLVATSTADHSQGDALVIANLTDGDQILRRVAVEGTAIDGGAGMTGHLTLEESYVNGQGEALGLGGDPRFTCGSEVSWTATRTSNGSGDLVMWAFHAAATDDVDDVRSLFGRGVRTDAIHPLRGGTLTESIDEDYIACTSETSLGWAVGDDRKPFPTEGAPSTQADLVRLGVSLTQRRPGAGSESAAEF